MNKAEIARWLGEHGWCLDSEADAGAMARGFKAKFHSKTGASTIKNALYGLPYCTDNMSECFKIADVLMRYP